MPSKEILQKFLDKVMGGKNGVVFDIYKGRFIDFDNPFGELRDKSMDMLELPIRFENSLKRKDLRKVGQILDIVHEENARTILKSKGVGPKCIQSVVSALLKNGVPSSYFDESLQPIIKLIITE